MRHIGKAAALAVAAVAATAVLAFAQEKPAAPPAKAGAVAGPKIEVIPETKDAGTVAKGQMIESTFVVKNNGGSDLIISDARPGCGCTVASFDKVVKPGGEGKVISSVDTKNFSGPISKSILLISNDPDRPQLNLFIKATVKPFVESVPTGYLRFSVVKGDSASQDVVLVSEEKTFKPTVGEMAQPYVKAELAPAGDKDKVAGRAGEQYKLHVAVTGDAPEGLLNAPIRISTGVAQQPTLEIPVSGYIRARVSVTPAQVNFGNFTAGKDPITRNIIVTNNKPSQPVKVTKAEVSVPGFVTDVVPTQEGISYTVVVKASDKVKKGAIDGTVKLYTTDKEKAVIELPLKGEVL
ncbi:MAG TPA: DUF1573 domain-containing protein [Thermoanaerobaculia bacterium]|nr:DUF1573 domain-containing protein [Thermoanaerobaculia bacterium]